jgi:hypothetical protein
LWYDNVNVLAKKSWRGNLYGFFYFNEFCFIDFGEFIYSLQYQLWQSGLDLDEIRKNSYKEEDNV